MNRILKKEEQVVILPVEEFFDVLKHRKFCTDDITRQRVANAIGGRKGVVHSIEEKYQFDYFFFRPDGDTNTYSIPYESVV